jgi:DNA-binding transcriptional MerR regulator
MRIAELSRRSGVAIPTIKYYVREGLLPPGELTSPNQARYSEAHLRRLKVIRALVDVGDLSIAATREVLDSIDAPGKTLHQRLGKAQYAVTPSPALHGEVDEESWALAAREVEDLLRERGWQVPATSPALPLLTRVLATLHSLGHDDLFGLLDRYADAAEDLADAEVRYVLSRPDVEGMLEGVVIGTTLGDIIVAALRRLAQADVSARLTPEVASAGAAGRHGKAGASRGNRPRMPRKRAEPSK